MQFTADHTHGLFTAWAVINPDAWVELIRPWLDHTLPVAIGIRLWLDRSDAMAPA